MALISLENMRFRSFHGLYEEERIIGTDYLLDIWIDTDIKNAGIEREHDMDKVVRTVNYATVYEICQLEMAQPQKLLETVIKNITIALKFHFDNMSELRIRLRKLNPPVGGQLDWAAVLDVMSFRKGCAKCNKEMICYKQGKNPDKTCWCENGAKENIHPRTLELLAQRFKGECLCPSCLKEAEG
jgi:dihydroneopterin aldolase